jgi:DNA topoisomerase-1
MANTLIIVESPTKSKTIAKFLPKTYSVTASMGHLRDLPKSSFGVDLEHDFEPKYINIRGKGDLIKDLKTRAKNAKKIFLATDPDREGEAISWHLAYLLGLDPKAVCRIEFHEITASAVTTALKNARSIDMDMVDAQQARRIIDRIVGYKLSPLLWRKVRKGLSAGRVQSVAVKIIADREKEIKAFVPEEYWTLQVKLRQDVKAPLFTADVIKYKDEKLTLHNAEETLKAEKALAKAAYKVEESTRKDLRRRPLPPFTTSSLQQEAGRKLNFTTKKTMIVAQQLYEGINVGKDGSVGLITYMRTDSVRMANEARSSIREHIRKVYGSSYCPEKPNFFASRQSAQDAHEAIRPTAVERVPEEIERYLSKDQYKLYKLIWNRAVASQMAEAVYENTTLVISGGEYGLRASGSILKFDGYLKLFDKKEQGDAREVPFIPAPAKLELYKVIPGEQHFTEPPAHYTEAALVKELEEKGIGRPSTYAPIIQTIQDRGYVVRESKKLLVTELGQTVVDLLTQYFKDVINIPFSAELETELDEIAEHKVNKNVILKKFYEPFAKLLEEADKKIPKTPLPVVVSDVKCEKCGRMMVVKDGRYGKFLACPGFPECRNTKPILVKAGVKCPECGGEVIVRKTKTGRIFYGCSNYPTCRFTSWDKPSATEKCPECGHYMVEHLERGGKIKLYCSNAKCPNALPRHTVRHKVTTASILGVKHVVKKRRTAKGSKSKTGTTTKKSRAGARTVKSSKAAQ